MPTVLQIAALRPDAQASLDDAYTVHRMIGHGAPPPSDPAAIDAVVTGGHNGIPSDLLAGLPNLKIVAINGVGYDKVDLEAAKRRGIRVTNTPDVLTDDVADLAVGLTITLLRRLHHAHGFVTAGHWPKRDIALARKVSGKRFGILGMGRIGQGGRAAAGGVRWPDQLHRRGREIRAVQLRARPGATGRRVGRAGGVRAASKSTHGLVNRAVLDALGPDGALVNIARGSIVDEPALVAALQAGTLGGAALDVFVDEPNVPPALLSMDNVVLTPHIASATDETRQAMAQLMLDNLAAFFAGRELLTAVV